MSTIVTSTVPALCDAFLAKVAGLTEFVQASAKVTYGHPGIDPMKGTSLWLGDASPWEQSLVVSPGSAARKERYTVDGELWVLLKGNSAVKARDLAHELLSAAERATRGVTADGGTDLTLGVPGVSTVLLVPRSSRPLLGEEGRVHHIEFGLDVQAYLGLTG